MVLSCDFSGKKVDMWRGNMSVKGELPIVQV